MLAGSTQVTAENIAKNISIDGIHAELLPADKVKIVSQMVEQYANVAWSQ